MIYEKPKNEIFASDAKDGEIVEFPNIKRGWGVTENLGFIPPMEYFNAAFNRVDKSLAYQLQRGVGEWDKDMEYPIGAVVSLNGIIYIAKSQNTNKNPSENKEIWHVIASEEWCKQTFLNKDDKIDAYTKKESDKKFALKDDLPPLATENKVGIVKIKNIINAKEEDAAVTEKAVSDLLDINKSIGIDQTYQDVWAQRELNTYHPNTTDRPIIVDFNLETTSGSYIFHIVVDDVVVRKIQSERFYFVDAQFIVPAGSKYKIATPENATLKKLSICNNTNIASSWVELK